MIALTRTDIYLMELERLSNCSLREIAAITTDFHIALSRGDDSVERLNAALAATLTKEQHDSIINLARRGGMGRLVSQPPMG